MDSLVMTVEECAQTLKVSPNAIMKLIEAKELKAKKIGNDYRVLTISLLWYLEIPINTNCISDSITSSMTPFYNKRTINKVIDEVIQMKRCSIVNNTYEWLRGISNHIRRFFENKYIDEITSDDIQAFYLHINNNHCKHFLSKRMVVAIKDLMVYIFKYSLERKYIVENPMVSTLRLPKCNMPNPHKRFMDYDQINILLNLVKDSPIYYTITMLLMMSGLRIGEALGLYWENVDFSNNCLRIHHALVRDYKYDNVGKKQNIIKSEI